MQTEDHKHNSAFAKPSEERFDINALGVDSPRNKGDIVEAKFLAKASSLGFGVARPWSTERYDFILDSGYGFWRVQVKSNRGRADGAYLVKVSGYKRVGITRGQTGRLPNFAAEKLGSVPSVPGFPLTRKREGGPAAEPLHWCLPLSC
ncbi:MAG: group I intron-associated PD-(D/E)XK endonuclease [Terriglobales bacterium]